MNNKQEKARRIYEEKIIGDNFNYISYFLTIIIVNSSEFAFIKYKNKISNVNINKIEVIQAYLYKYDILNNEAKTYKAIVNDKNQVGLIKKLLKLFNEWKLVKYNQDIIDYTQGIHILMEAEKETKQIDLRLNADNSVMYLPELNLFAISSDNINLILNQLLK